MRIMHAQCAALDVHKRTVTATRRHTQSQKQVEQETLTFGTMTADLLALDDWLKQQAIEVIALESTGVYTPPPMLQIGGGPIKRERRREWTDAKNHADLLLIDLHPFD